MAGTVVPFTFITGKTDTSDFRALTRPLRTFTPREEWVFEQLAIDWAELNGLEQKAVYAQACLGTFTEHLAKVFKKTTTEVVEGIDRASQQYGAKPGVVPKREYLVGSSDLPILTGFTLLDSFATTLLQLQAAVGHEMGRVASRSLDPPSAAELAPRVKRGFWQRFLDG